MLVIELIEYLALLALQRRSSKVDKKDPFPRYSYLFYSVIFYYVLSIGAFFMITSRNRNKFRLFVVFSYTFGEH